MGRVAVNGVHFNVARAGVGPPLVLLHGFTGSVATWSPVLDSFARHHATIAVDLLGHGDSDAPGNPARYAIERAVDDLVGLLDRLAVPRATWLGYSMGGRVALHLAATRPERVSALVLESASPGIADPRERTARAGADQALATAIGREGIAAFVERWERLPLFASQRRLPEETLVALRRQRLANDPVGLANCLRGLGPGKQLPLQDRLGDLTMQVLIVVGAEDEKYRRLADEMARVLPVAEIAVVGEAGHAVHLEQPERFAEIVLGFLGRVGGRASESEDP